MASSHSTNTVPLCLGTAALALLFAACAGVVPTGPDPARGLPSQAEGRVSARLFPLVAANAVSEDDGHSGLGRVHSS